MFALEQGHEGPEKY